MERVVDDAYVLGELIRRCVKVIVDCRRGYAYCLAEDEPRLTPYTARRVEYARRGRKWFIVKVRLTPTS